MRVGMYYNNQDVRAEDLPKPKPGEGELLVKVKASGICGSDIMQWYRLKKAPLVLGHEIAGDVVESGHGSLAYKIGTRVFVAHHVPCNSCHYCLSGNHTACETLHTTNYSPGGFSEYIRVPKLNVLRGVFVLPDSMSYETGTFIEPLACVLRAQKLIGLKKGQSVVILGSGISGLLHLLLAKEAGAKPLVVSDINSLRINKAKELGADAAVSAKEDIASMIRKLNDNRLADHVIICTGAHAAFEQALGLIDRGGAILCFAPTEPGVKLGIPVNEFWRNAIKIFHSYGSSPEDNKNALELLSKNKLAVERLITHRFSLEDIGEAFRVFSEGKEAIKVIIQP